MFLGRLTSWPIPVQLMHSPLLDSFAPNLFPCKTKKIIRGVFKTNWFCKIKFSLAHFMPLNSFHNPWKNLKTCDFPMFSGGKERDQ